jgi:hypothetical protein
MEPGRAALTGGAIVLTAVIANEAFAAWRGKSTGDVTQVLTPGP